MSQTKTRYVISNSLKALLWLAVFALIYVVFKKHVDINFIARLRPFFDNQLLILTIFLISEVIVGIIPPEVFIIWALRNDNLTEFITLIAILTTISYCAGLLGYLIGHYLSKSLFYRFLKRRFLTKLDQHLQNFGMYLIIIAALTPIPFSGVSMLIGSVKFPFRRFALFALTRVLRFVIYGYIFWSLNPNI